MKNVLLVGESYSGGVKTYIDTIMTNQQQLENICIKALVSSKRFEINKEIGSDYFIEDNLSFGKSPFKLARALKKLHWIVKEHNIDIIHANSTFSGLVMYLYTFYNRNPFYIYTPHGYYSFKNMGKTKRVGVMAVEKRINAASDLVIHVSPSEEDAAIKNGLISPEKSLVILNGAKDPKVVSFEKTDGKFTIVNLARVDEPKNPFEFIDIACKLLEVIPAVQFVWAGDGRYLKEAREKVKECHLGDKIMFIGFSEQKEKILEKSDLYFSVSDYEGLPFAVVEAMSYKLPLLLSDITGHKDLVKGTENGLLFKKNDYQEIYDFVRNLIGNKQKWNAMSESSYRIFTEQFTIKQMLRKLLDVYESV